MSTVSTVTPSNNWSYDRMMRLFGGMWFMLLALCVAENCRTTVAALLQGVTGRVAIYRGYIQDSSETGFAVAQYDGLTLAALENKLAQFPKGKVFAWQGNGSLSPGV